MNKNEISTHIKVIYEGRVDLSHTGHRPVASSCEQGNKPTGSIQDGKFQDKLCDN